MLPFYSVAPWSYAKEDPDSLNKGLYLGWRRDELPCLIHTVIVVVSLWNVLYV